MKKSAYKKVIQILIAAIPNRKLAIIVKALKGVTNDQATILKKQIKKFLKKE